MSSIFLTVVRLSYKDISQKAASETKSSDVNLLINYMKKCLFDLGFI